MNKITRRCTVIIFIFLSAINVYAQKPIYKSKYMSLLSVKMIFSIGLGFILGAFLMYLFRKRKERRFLSEKDEEIYKLKFDNNKLRKKVIPVPERIPIIVEIETQSKIESANTIESIPSEMVSTTSESPYSSTNPIQENNIIYFASPNQDGSFPDINKSPNYIDEVHNYKLIIQNGIYGSLEFLNNTRSRITALQSPHQYIKPVFEESNDFTSKTISIKMVDNGNWHLENNIWVRKNKAKIKYE